MKYYKSKEINTKNHFLVNSTWPVSGSKGNEYSVEMHDKGFTCECLGFTYNSKCKHISYITTLLTNENFPMYSVQQGENRMNYDDSMNTINSVIRDIAVWDMKREGNDPVDEGMIDDWIFEFSLIASKQDFINICKQYWEAYLDPPPTIH